MNRKEQKKETRIKILKAAYKVYSTIGFNASTLTIAKEANVSHGTIFVHFPTLSDLQISLIEEFASKIASEMHNLCQSNSSIESLLSHHLDMLIKYEDFYSNLIRELVLLPDEVKLYFANLQVTIAFHFNQVFEREIENKNIKNISVHMLFNSWISLVHYYLLNKDLFAPNKSVIKSYKNELINTYISLISIDK